MCAMSQLTRSTLCLACKSIFDGNTPKNDFGEVAHHGLEALAQRATRGCHLCLTVYISLDPDVHKSSRKGSTGDDSQGFAWLSPIARDQARLKFRYVRNRGSSPVEVDRRKTQTPMSVDSSKSSLLFNFKDENEFDDVPAVVELILMNPRYAVEPGVRSINIQSVSTSSLESFDIARQWLAECYFNHMKCSVSDGGAIRKPTHVLDVSIKGPKGAQGVRLVDGMFLDPLSEYVTLSHCWGRTKGIRLHKGSLAALRHGVAADSLPKTFAEAAMVTQKLGFRYLWIDALCIMHDNEQAVLTEVSQMSQIYSEAALNLAATSSRDDTMGLIYSRNPLALQPCVIEAKSVGIEDGMYKCLRSNIWHDLIDSSPLSKRAWTFQERCLAKRTIHFTRDELLWECQQMCCSEVFPKGLPATTANPTIEQGVEYLNKRTHHQRHGHWYQLVNMYTKGRLTYSSDKLPAIAGLAKQYMGKNRLRDEDYVCGLWRPQLPQSLLWRVDQGRRPMKYRAPSWSWASIEGEIAYPEASQTSKETCLEIIDIQLNHKGDVFSQVDGGRLKIRGFLARGLLRRTHDYWGKTSCVIQCSKTVIEIESAWFDERLYKLSEGSSGLLTEQLEIYLLPVVDVVDHVEGLILCSNIKRGEFRRLGAFEVPRYDQVNWDKFRTIMKGDADMQNYEERLDHTNGFWFASDYTYTVNLI